MSEEKILGKTVSNMEDLKALLGEISESSDLLNRLIESPLAVLDDAGIVLEEYATDELSTDEVAHYIATLVHLMIAGRVGFGPEPIHENTWQKFRERGMDKNWNRERHSKRNYQPMTETTPGRVKERKRSESIHTKDHLSRNRVGLSPGDIETLAGPLISDEAFEIILANIKNLKHGKDAQ